MRHDLNTAMTGFSPSSQTIFIPDAHKPIHYDIQYQQLQVVTLCGGGANGQMELPGAPSSSHPPGFIGQ